MQGGSVKKMMWLLMEAAQWAEARVVGPACDYNIASVSTVCSRVTAGAWSALTSCTLPLVMAPMGKSRDQLMPRASSSRAAWCSAASSRSLRCNDNRWQRW